MVQEVKKIAFKTLGCRLNQFESGSLATLFRDSGYQLVDFSDDADVYVVNTCTVTNQGDQKSRNTLHQATKRAHKPVVVVTGCMAESSREKLLQDDSISYVVGNNHKSHLLSLIDAHFNGETFSFDPSERHVFDFNVSDKIFKTRAMLKIQDGCDNFCTFCIIPFVRGRAISRPPADIIQEARQLIDKGYHEIVVTGVNIGRYHYEGVTFEDVVEKLLELPGEFRLRISSMEPEGIGGKFLELIKHPKLCPHLHLCLQSGSDRILMQMRRMYNIHQYLGIIGSIRSLVPGFNFTTDILVGFPGETEDDFNETCNIVKEVGFSHVHTFKYSLRDGTRAARMGQQLPEKIKSHRSMVVRELSQQGKQNYRNTFIGKEQTVLVEKKRKDSILYGYGENYLPIAFQGLKQDIDTFQKVRVVGMANNPEMDLLAEKIG